MPGGFAPGKPLVAQMLAGRKRYRNALRNFESEYVLGILGRSRRITMAPLRKDLVNVRKLPIAHTAVSCGIDSGLLGELSRGGMLERLSRLDASRHRLPVLGKISALHQQNVELPRINDDEDRNGLLVMHVDWSFRGRCRSAEEPAFYIRAQKTGPSLRSG